MKILIRTVTIVVVLICLLTISLQSLFVEIRKREFTDAISIATKRTVDA